MHRILPFFLTVAAFAAAPTNQLVITNTSGAIETNRPVRFGRPFAEGEIWGHPQPVVDGSPATSWQATVKTRHRDGRSSCTVTGATNEYPITVTCPDHGYRTGDYVTIAGVLGNTAANGTHRIVRRSRDMFFLQKATGNGTYISGGTATGPGPGSVRFAIVVVDGIDLDADESTVITFQDSSNTCHLGGQATCDAAALTASEMLAWDSSGWGAEIKATQGNTYVANARTMVAAGDFEYWIAGPILTEVIARDHSTARVYDFGWTCSANCTTDYASATWVPDATHRSLSPIFVLSFYDARPNALQTEYILENVWYGHLQEQRYSVELTSDSSGSTSEYTKAEFTHYARTRWRKVFWDGTEPGAININHDEASWEYSGAVPVWADDVEPGAVDISAQNSSACASGNFDINGSGCITKYFPTSGGHADIGVFTKSDSMWLQTFDSGLWNQVWNNGNVSGHIPVHMRDANESADLYFVDIDGDGATSGDAGDAESPPVFGRIYSVDAHPTGQAYGNGGAVAGLSSSHGWTVDRAHQPGFAFAAYLATGEWYLMEELQFWSGFNLGDTNPDHFHTGRGRSFGIITPGHQTRGVAWSGRNLLRAAWISPDGTVEKEYLTNKVESNLMAHEGRFESSYHGIYYLPLIGQADSAPCNGQNFISTMWTKSNPYCWGRTYLNQYSHLTDPMGTPLYNSTTSGCDGLTTAAVCDSPWMQDYLIAAFYGHGKDLGFKTDGLLKMVAKWRFQFLHEDHNPYLTFTYRIPTILNTTGTYALSPAQHFNDGYTEAGHTQNVWTDSGVYWEGGYGFSYIHGALPYLMEGRLGNIVWPYVWNWYTNESNVENTSVRCAAGAIGSGCATSEIEVRWNIAPRFDATELQYGVPGANALLLRYTAPSERSCSVDVDEDPSFGSVVASEIDGGGGRDRRQLIGGLSAGQEYFYRITCLDDVSGHTPLTGSMTTLGAGGATAVQIRPAPPANQGITAVRITSGPAGDVLNTDSGAIACDPGCTVSIPATTSVPLFYQLEYLSGDNAVSTGRIEAVIP